MRRALGILCILAAIGLSVLVPDRADAAAASSCVVVKTVTGQQQRQVVVDGHLIRETRTVTKIVSRCPAPAVHEFHVRIIATDWKRVPVPRCPPRPNGVVR